jgi:hypothetical protein
MRKLTDGMLLYHGSYTEVPDVDLSKCKKGLDFGHGFYVTSSYEQAHSYIPSAVRKAVATHRVSSNFNVDDGKVNIYKFRMDPNLLIHYFDEADLNWLHFVATNRDNDLFPKLIEKFSLTDIIGGKVADDNTARTLTFYTQGDWGQPGDPETDTLTLKRLLPNRLNDQFCFRTPDAIASLEFIRSERYGDNHRSSD